MTDVRSPPVRSAPAADRVALSAAAVDLGYGERSVVEGLSLNLIEGTVTTIVGPNGCGKSTVLRSLGRLLRPASGSVYLNGRDIAQRSSRDVAKELAILPQNPIAPTAITVRELVEQGRFPHSGPLRMLRHQDHEAIRGALRSTGLEAMVDRELDTLSGGERQRAWIALALAQDTQVLLLDEPTTFLDVGFQLDVLELVKELNATRQLTIVMVLHDLNHAAAYSDRIIAMRSGAVVADGDPTNVLVPDTIRAVFGVESIVVPHPRTGVPVCLPFERAADRRPEPGP